MPRSKGSGSPTLSVQLLLSLSSPPRTLPPFHIKRGSDYLIGDLIDCPDCEHEHIATRQPIRRPIGWSCTDTDPKYRCAQSCAPSAFCRLHQTGYLPAESCRRFQPQEGTGSSCWLALQIATRPESARARQRHVTCCFRPVEERTGPLQGFAIDGCRSRRLRAQRCLPCRLLFPYRVVLRLLLAG